MARRAEGGRGEAQRDPLHVLSLEDSAIDADLIAAHLEMSGLDCAITRVWTRSDYERALSSGRFDVILADHVLPAFDGDTALALARDMSPETPFIFVSGTLGEELAVEALKRGATDYVVKQRMQRLPQAVTRAITEARDRAKADAVEQQLRDTRRRLDAVLDNASVSVFVIDEGQRCVYMNAAAEELTGYSLAETQGRPLHDVIHHTHPDGRPFPIEDCPIDRAFPEDHKVQGEEVFVHRDGSFYPVAFTASPMRDETARTVGTILEVRDIRQEKAAAARRDRAERELRELNQTLEQRVSDALAERKVLADIVESTDAFVQVADLDYRWLAINKASADEFERIFGVRPKVGDSMLDILAHAPEHQAAVKAVWSRALAGEEFTEVAEFGDPDKDRRYYEMKYNTLRDAAGRRIGAYQFVYDVTGRLSDQARLRAIFETSHQFQALIGLDGTLLEANATSMLAIGASQRAVIGRAYWDTPWFSATPGLPEKIKDALSTVVATCRAFHEEIALELPTGRRTFEFLLRPMRGSRGEFAAIVAEAVETTERRMAEEALRQSQKLESMGQLTGGVAHDFNNLLTPIVGSLDLLQRRGELGERERRLVAGALASADRAKTLVQRLLAFARRQPLQAAPVDVAELARGMADLLASTSGPKIRVAIDAGDGLRPAMVDANQLELAILNLGVNARDAMPQGGTLTIRIVEEQVGPGHRSGAAPGGYVLVSVSDTGIGMDEVTLARAIEPFFSTKGIGKGTGLGLSMVHGLVAQLNGGFAIGSAEGQGTTVELWLPVSAEALREPASSNVAAVGARSGTVLLVDDEELVRAATADMLAEMGYDVVDTPSAEGALERMRAGLQPDLIVTDHLMPGMSGTDLARRIRATSPVLPVLIVSGYADVDEIACDLPRLAKPFCQADLAEAVEQAVNNDAAERSPRRSAPCSATV